MKVGIKTYTDKEGYKYLKKIVDFCDFVEILPIPTNRFWKKFKDYDIPFTIHSAHQKFGADPGHVKSHKKTDLCINTAIEAANYFDSDVIVVHPGVVGKTRRSSMKIALKYLKKFKEPRFYFENLPSWKHHIELGTYPEEIETLMKKLKGQFCFDISHAALSAPMLNVDYKKFVKSFMRLKPKYFHICGGNVMKHDDHHPLMEGNYDEDYFKSLLPKKCRVLLETPHTVKKHIQDINFLKK